MSGKVCARARRGRCGAFASRPSQPVTSHTNSSIPNAPSAVKPRQDCVRPSDGLGPDRPISRKDRSARGDRSLPLPHSTRKVGGALPMGWRSRRGPGRRGCAQCSSEPDGALDRFLLPTADVTRRRRSDRRPSIYLCPSPYSRSIRVSVYLLFDCDGGGRPGASQFPQQVRGSGLGVRLPLGRSLSRRRSWVRIPSGLLVPMTIELSRSAR